MHALFFCISAWGSGTETDVREKCSAVRRVGGAEGPNLLIIHSLPPDSVLIQTGSKHQIPAGKG